MNPLFINTIILGGSTNDKIAAAGDAGFDQIELWRQDVVGFQKGAPSLKAELAKRHVALTDYQVLLDFDGAPDSIRDSKRLEALSMLDTAVALGTDTLLAPACTRPDCVVSRIEEDLGWLADEAAIRGLRIAYEAMCWSTVNFLTPAAWDLIQRLNRPNLGLVVDAFHIFARGRTAADLAGIPADRIFLVQLSDLTEKPDLSNIVQIARHHRLLPGHGYFPVKTILTHLRAIGYAGPMGLEVFNDDMKASNPFGVACEGMAALKSVWLEQ